MSESAETNEPAKTGTSILLRLSPQLAAQLRRVAKTEERTITTVVTRALKQYFHSEHKIEIND